jgi:heme A synthase
MSVDGLTFRSKVLAAVALVLLAVALGVATANYPLRPRPPAGHVDAMGLGLALAFSLAIAGGLVLARVGWRERCRRSGSVRRLLVYPAGAVAGASVPAAYLTATPSFAGGLVVWYEVAVIVGGVCGVVVEVASWE